MWRRREVTLVVGVAALSMLLTSLTVWAVGEQGRALLERASADWRGGAIAAAEQRNASVRGDAQRACDAAARFWEVGGVDELDVWVSTQRFWQLACVTQDRTNWTALPLTPFERPIPTPPPLEDANEPAPTTTRGASTQPAESPLEYLKRFATGADPLARAGALLSTATREEQGGHPLAAARLLADAAYLLRSTPGLVRFAFRAESSRIDSLLRADDLGAARAALTDLLASVRKDHPNRLGPLELARVERQVGQIAPHGDDPLRRELEALRARVRRRESLLAAAVPRLTAPRATLGGPEDELAFTDATLPGGERLVIVSRRIGDKGALLALVVPLDELFTRYWRPPAGASWRVARGSVAAEAPLRVDLAAPFHDAALTPSVQADTDLDSLARRRMIVVLATATGTAGAWSILLWLILRAIVQQRQLVRMQSRFVADVSHELKTPLAMIRLLSETLLEQRVVDPERIRKYHETITRESERLTALLDNILDVGRIEQGRKTYAFGTCDIGTVARRAWALFEPQFATDGFDARLEIDSDLPPTVADAAALQQVLVNLLQNAHRYAGQGKYVRLSVHRQENVIVIEVEDHGIGMSRGQMNRVGQTFFRADDSRVRQTRGTGLGLAIVKHIVAAHQGSVDVHSRPNLGTKFTIWIPIAAPTAE